VIYCKVCVTIIQRCGTGTGTGVDGEKLKFIVCLATIVQLFVQQPPTAAEASNICTDAAAAAYRRGDNVGPYVKVNQDHQNQYQSKASILYPIKFSWLYTVTTLCVKKTKPLLHFTFIYMVLSSNLRFV